MSPSVVLALLEALLKLVPEVVTAIEGAHAAVSAKSKPVEPVPEKPSSQP